MTAELAASPRGPDSTPVEYEGRRRGEGASLLDVLHIQIHNHILLYVCTYACMLFIGLAVGVRGTTAVVFLYYLHAMWSRCVNTQ